MIFLDSNIPMYLVGDDDARRAHVAAVVRRLVGNGDRMVTDVEVYQEILHRYLAIRRQSSITIAFDTLDALAEAVLPIERPHLDAARDLANAHPTLSARDALHLAVMRQAGIERILSFDRGFDAVAGIERITA
ncbi:MAG: type II toxin-antitoxin system VapC family toxin [Sporichthyaceae bacterium]